MIELIIQKNRKLITESNLKRVKMYRTIFPLLLGC